MVKPELLLPFFVAIGSLVFLLALPLDAQQRSHVFCGPIRFPKSPYTHGHTKMCPQYNIILYNNKLDTQYQRAIGAARAQGLPIARLQLLRGDVAIQGVSPLERDSPSRSICRQKARTFRVNLRSPLDSFRALLFRRSSHTSHVQHNCDASNHETLAPRDHLGGHFTTT